MTVALADAGDDDDDMEENESEEEAEISMPERDDSILTFSKHTDSLFCGNFNPDGTLAVTGGEDDRAFVWNVESGESVFEVTGHKDSVIAAEFSYDGNYLATGDMAGDIKVFKVEKEYKNVFEFSMGDMSWMKWHKKSNVLTSGAESGEIYIWRIPSGDCIVLQGNGDKCEVANFTSDGKKLAAGYGDGTFKLWDVKTQQVLLNIPPVAQASTSATEAEEEEDQPPAIIRIDTDRADNLIIAGAVNGTAKLIGKNGLLGVLPVCVAARGSDSSSIESVLIDCPDFEIKVAVTGSLNGKVLVWDVSHQSIRHECKDEQPTGIIKMVWGKEQTIVAGTLGGAVKAWNVRNGEMKFTLLGHSDNIHDLCYHEKKNLLLTVSEDHTAKIFTLPM